MRKRAKVGGARAKARRPKATKPNRRNIPKADLRAQSTPTGEKVARLTHERDEALQQQAATSEVLKIIRHSPANTQPVFDAIVESAALLSGAIFSVLYLYDGDRMSIGATSNFNVKAIGRIQEIQQLKRPERSHLAGRAILERAIVHVPDVLADPEYSRELAMVGGWRAVLSVPLLREGNPVGTLSVGKAEPTAFSDRQVRLLQTFADQAVIAIENTRLLNELRERTTDLTEALKQQTATSDVLQVISTSPGDLEPVFATMLENAVGLCEASFGDIYRWKDGGLRLLAQHNTPPAFAEERKRSQNISPGSDSPTARMLATKMPIHIIDLAQDRAYVEKSELGTIAAVELGGVRTFLGVPMLKEDELIGMLFLNRRMVRPFTDKQIELVKNFAAQAVVAIENARLLSELRERTEEVGKLNQHLEQRVADQVSEIERMGRLRRFLPPQVADLIVAAGTEKQLESHRREITALFCDLRGFTGFSESSDPEDVMALLRDYHAAIGEIIIKYSGTLERYAGDGVMVVFNDPVPVDNPALQAVLMALEMRDAIGALTEKWSRLGHDIGFGIGIAHGFATLGTIGFEGRFDYAAIGTVSNVASRLCDEAKPGQILISPRVLMAVENAVTVEPVGEFALKGIRRPLAAYNVLAANPLS